MYQIDFARPCHVYFVGIGGISMSGLAHILLTEGFAVSGSDLKKTELTDELCAAGARIVYDQTSSHIPQGCDVVVYTAAVHADHPEIVDAQARKIPLLTRAELLGQIMSHYRTAVNVAGTHGKTTTTSMISEILLAGNLDPTISLGGVLGSIGGNVRVGGPDLFVAEACEYTNSFLSFFPTTAVVLNIEADHLDFFKDIDDIRHSFRRFMELLPSDGLLVINSRIKDLDKLTAGLSCRIVTYGDASADYSAENIVYDNQAHPSFDVISREDGNLFRVTLKVPGEHNVSNALAAVAVARSLNVPAESIVRGLAAFSGTKRRFEHKGEVGGVTLIDDYAHHPQEITATLKAAAKCPHKRLWCVFQPHTYTRTKALLDEFAEALSLADEVILAKIYPARETDDLGISSEDIRVRLEKLGTPAWYIDSFPEIEKFILKNCIPGDLLITMGAGDVVNIGNDLLAQ